MLPLIVNRFLVYASLETYTIQTSVKFYPICEFDKIRKYNTGENCIFILKLFNKGTVDEYDMFTLGCNSIVRLNRRAESTAD